MAANAQRGAALITAMITVALVATLAASSAWQQWRTVEIEIAQRNRLQASWILVGALDFARLILLEDARSGGVDHLLEPWAVPLEDARLSTFLAANANTFNREDDALEVLLSGHIVDQQGLLNFRNLIDGEKVSKTHLAQFLKLFKLLGLPESEVQSVADNLHLALATRHDTSSGALAPWPPQRLQQLTQLGLSPHSLLTLAPYATWLPESTRVNLNTAPAQVIYATLADDDMALAQRLVTARAMTPFQSLEQAERSIGGTPGQIQPALHSISTRYFGVHGRLRLGDLMVQEHSTVRRDGTQVHILWRERQTPSTLGKGNFTIRRSTYP